MMMYSRFLLSVGTIALIAACSSGKKTQQTAALPDPPAINLDTISIVADAAPKKELYRGSNPRLNDILHTKLEVKFDWQKSWMYGKATITAKPYFYATNVLTLDARGMQINEVAMVSKLTAPTKVLMAETPSMKLPLQYTYENDSLKINLGKTFTRDEEYTIYIDYVAKPDELKTGGSDAITSDKGLYFINPKGEDPDKMPQIWTQGETQANSAWFPCIDSPNEKMTDEIYMTVDKKYTTLSNGTLVNQTNNSDGTRTDYWKMDLPHSVYLVMMAVGEFKKVTDKPWNGKEISYYVEKEYEPHAMAIFGNTPEMVDFFSKRLGTPFAWQKYAQIVVRDYVSGAMENTSATLHGDFVVYQTTRETIDGKKGEDVISHELFHQWFGDLATAESWSNLPLNESFATYGEYLWQEYKNGRDAADAHSYSSRLGYASAAQQKQVDLVRFHYESREDMFDAFSYNKGGQILHMLRKAVGDDAFFASLKLYLERSRFKPAEVHELRLAFEEVTGQDMNWFFNQWFYASGHPKVDVTKKYDEATKKLTLTIKQEQDFKKVPLYRLPMEVDLYYAGKTERQHIVVENVSQDFVFQVPVNPDLVNVDAERQLLSQMVYVRQLPEMVFQYKHAPLYLDRYEAIQFLAKHLSEKEAMEALKQAAEKDNWYGLRIKALEALMTVAPENEADLKPLFLRIAASDANTNVRAKAIDALAASYKGAELEELYVKSLSEQSYAIVGSALDAIGKSNPELAMKKAKSLENETGKDLVYSIVDLYAKNGGDEQNEFMLKAQKQFHGYELMGYMNFYGKYLKRSDNAQNVIAGAEWLAKQAKSDNQYIRYYAQKVLKDQVLAGWQEKETTLKAQVETAQKQNQSTADSDAKLKTVSATVEKLSEIYKGATAK